MNLGKLFIALIASVPITTILMILVKNRCMVCFFIFLGISVITVFIDRFDYTPINQKRSKFREINELIGLACGIALFSSYLIFKIMEYFNW